MVESTTVILLFAVKLLYWLPALWRYRPVGTITIGILEIILTLALLVLHPSIWTILFAIFEAYQLFNLWRIHVGRMQADHLRRVTFRTAIVLLLLQLSMLIAADISNGSLATATRLLILAIAQVAIAIVVYSSTQRHLSTTRTLQATESYTDRELPSVSVLIPARNETDDLHECLKTLVASNYPKLEIIVLDDCSQNKRTPEIIRDFAHDGVRFIAGQSPPNHWLAKNYAYQQLAEAASGEYLLFCGVDVRLSPGAIRELITTMLEKKKTMLSILPKNDRPTDGRVYFIQPMRYAWELCLPRKLFNRPPVLSTCWIIQHKALLAAGSFKAASRSILPESHLARSVARNDGYSFLRSDMLLSTKPMPEQLATAVRMRYPQLHRRPESVAMLSIIELGCIAMPLLVMIGSLVMAQWTALLLSSLAYVLFTVVYWQVTGVMYGRLIWRGIVLAPVAALYDLVLLHVSMYRYEFGEVRWKERNVCLPVMRADGALTATASTLPKLD